VDRPRNCMHTLLHTIRTLASIIFGTINKHHGDNDYGAIIDGGLDQESIEASSPVHGDQREA
jgi:hypothetical protein